MLKRSIQNARSHGLKVIHYSFQRNHVHLILEAATNAILTKGMRSLTITMAKGVKMGRIQIERYHLHVLKSVRETRHAVHYVLFIEQKHDLGTYTQVNEYSSLMSAKGGLELVRKFAKGNKVTIQVHKGGDWKPDEGRSFLFRRAWDQLLS